MKFGDIITYHCQCCGSNIDLTDDKCHYCGSTKLKRISKKPESIRLFADLGDRKFYFHEVNAFHQYRNPQYIEANYSTDSYPRFVKSLDSDTFGFQTNYTIDSTKKIEMVCEKHIVTIGIEVAGMDKVFKLKGRIISTDLPTISQNEILTREIGFGVEDYCGYVDNDFNVVPESASCPNCGAKVTKQFGLCDYCGGWIEYNDRFD